MTDTAGRLRLKDPSSGGYSFDFGTVTDISETFQKSCSVTPIVTKPKQSAFPIESRTYKQITVSFTRKQPDDVRNSGSDSAKWSNSYWTTMLMSSLDRWQARTDGYRLSYVPAPDNPFIAPIKGAGDETAETGYVKNLSLRSVKGRPESIQGSFEFHVGSMRVKNRPDSVGGYPRTGFFIILRDENGANGKALLSGLGDNPVNLVDSCTITGGPEAPFEYAQVTIPRKALSAAYPDLLTEGETRIRAGRTRLTIALAGTSEMTVTKVKLSGNTLTLTAYCNAEKLKGYVLNTDSNLSLNDWINEILTSGNYGAQFSEDNIVRAYTLPEGVENYDAREEMMASFAKGTNIWYILQTVAMMCGARVFFAKDKAYLVDYRTNAYSVSPVKVDLYREGYAGAVVGNVDLGDEGMDTVVNVVKVRCAVTDTTADGRYVYDGTDQKFTVKDLVIKEPESVKYYVGEREGGQYNLSTIKQNDPDVKLLYNGSTQAPSEGGTETPDSGESGSEGSEGGNAGETPEPGVMTDGVSVTYDLARRFGANFLDYVSEAQQTVTFTLRELAGSGVGSWAPYFQPAAMASEIIDSVNELSVDNKTDFKKDNGKSKYQKLALKTYSQAYPECKTEYTWGVLASMDLSSNTSRIMSAQSGQ